MSDATQALHGTAADLAAPPVIDRVQRRSLLIGVVAAIVCLIGAVTSPQHFYRAYLVGYMEWLGVGMGCLALLIMQYLTKGNWGFTIRRQLEAGSRTLPLLAVLVVPLFLGMKTLYPWARPLSAEDQKLAKFSSGYMSPPGVITRAVICFSIWLVLMFLLNRWGKWQDENDEHDLARSRRFQKLCGPGMILYALSITVVVVDWVMSLDPHFYSTMYGLVFVDGQGLAAMTFCIAMSVMMTKYKPMSDVLKTKVTHDLGNLTLAMVMIWAYFSFSQFLLIWSANLPEEIEWFIARTRNGWGSIAVFLGLFHFCVPFFLLLMKFIKRHPQRLVKVAVLLFVMRYVDLYWYIMPSFANAAGRKAFDPNWLDLAVPLAIGALWIAAFCAQLKKRPLFPMHDILWAEVEKAGHGH